MDIGRSDARSHESRSPERVRSRSLLVRQTTDSAPKARPNCLTACRHSRGTTSFRPPATRRPPPPLPHSTTRGQGLTPPQHLESLSEQSHPTGTPDRPRPRIHVVIRASDSACAIPRSAGTRASVPTSAAAPCTAERKSRTVGGAQIAYCLLMTTMVTSSEGGAKDTRPACTATKISQAAPSFDSLTTVSKCWCGGNGFELPTI